MKNKLRPFLTWQELKDRIASFTPEQLANDVIVYNTLDGDAWGVRSVLVVGVDEEDPAAMTSDLFDQGQPYLTFNEP